MYLPEEEITNIEQDDSMWDDVFDVTNPEDHVQIIYEDDMFKLMVAVNQEGAAYLCRGTSWEWYNRDENHLNNYHVLEEKTNKKRKFWIYKGYGEIHAASGASYSGGTWIAKNGSIGLKQFFLKNNYPYLTTQLQKKIGSEVIKNKGDEGVYEYPPEVEGGYNARRNAVNITKIKIKPGTEAIKELSGFSQVKDIYIPDGVKRINSYSMSGLDSLEHVRLPDTLKRIGRCAFCNSIFKMEEIFIPASVTTMDDDIFYSWNRVGGNPDLHIYCEAPSKPAGWKEGWNNYEYQGWDRTTNKPIYTKFEVTWGASRPADEITEDLDDDTFEVQSTLETKPISVENIKSLGEQDSQFNSQFKKSIRKSYEITDGSKKQEIYHLLDLDLIDEDNDLLEGDFQWVVCSVLGQESIHYYLLISGRNLVESIPPYLLTKIENLLGVKLHLDNLKEEDDSFDVAYPEFVLDDISEEFVMPLIDRFFEIENTEHPMSEEEEKRRRDRVMFFLKQNGKVFANTNVNKDVIVYTDLNTFGAAPLIILHRKDFDEVIHEVNPDVDTKALLGEDLEDSDFDTIPAIESGIKKFVSNDALFEELVREHGNERCWWLTLSDGEWESVSGLDELSGDEQVGGLMTFDEAERKFLDYDFSYDYEATKEMVEGEEFYFHSDLCLNCGLNLDPDMADDLDSVTDYDFEESRVVAVRTWHEDSEHPEDTLKESEDDDSFEAADHDLGGYKLSTAELRKIDDHKSDLWYDDHLIATHESDINELWFSFDQTDSASHHWYLFKVKDNDTFSHSYNVKYPYILVYQGLEDSDDFFAEYEYNGLSVGRLSDKTIEKVGINKDNIPEIDLHNTLIHEEFLVEDSEDSGMDDMFDIEEEKPGIRVEFEDDTWKVETPLTWGGILKLSAGTLWGFSDEFEKHVGNENIVTNHPAFSGINSEFKVTSWNNARCFVFTNKKDSSKKYIYFTERTSLPDCTGRGYSGQGFFFNKEGQQPDEEFSDKHLWDKEYFEAFLKSTQDAQLQKWAISKWGKGSLKSLNREIKALQKAEKLNYTIEYNSNEYKELQYAMGYSSLGDKDYINFGAKNLIKKVIIPDGVTTIEMAAFRNWAGLEDVVFSDSVTEIGGSAFSCCSKLVINKLPSHLKKINSCAFKYCKFKDGKLNIPSSVKVIGDYAFADCKSLQNVYIPKSVIWLGQNVFYDCDRNLQIRCGASAPVENSWNESQKVATSSQDYDPSNWHFGLKRTDTLVQEDLEDDFEASEPPEKVKEDIILDEGQKMILLDCVRDYFQEKTSLNDVEFRLVERLLDSNMEVILRVETSSFYNEVTNEDEIYYMPMILSLDEDGEPMLAASIPAEAFNDMVETGIIDYQKIPEDLD